MNITPEMLLPFQQLADAAWEDDADDGQTRDALGAANRAYIDAVAGTYAAEDAALYIREKLMVAAYCAQDSDLDELYGAIVALALTLDVNLMPDSVIESAPLN